VLAAMREVPRHLFVPEEERPFAYGDHPLPIGRGQTISQPYIVAAMAEALALKPSDRVLEVGSGSGYAAAVLASLAGEVYGIELEQELYEKSLSTLGALGVKSVELRRGDGFRGWPERAPFDAILLSCAAEEIPLKEGGRLLYPRGTAWGEQELVLVVKSPRGPVSRRLEPVRFVPLRREP
jgi:protein-L-isoaspartate(D-aspartate) O-methyltransferase